MKDGFFIHHVSDAGKTHVDTTVNMLHHNLSDFNFPPCQTLVGAIKALYTTAQKVF